MGSTQALHTKRPERQLPRSVFVPPLDTDPSRQPDTLPRSPPARRRLTELAIRHGVWPGNECPRAVRFSMRASILFAGLVALALASAPNAQTDLPPLAVDTTAARYGSSTAIAFNLTEFGLGIGASGRTRLTDDLSIAVELAVGAGRDEREQRFFVGFLGDTVIPFKRNYVLLAPLHIGIEQRLFRRSVEDNFRPFVHASVGPTLALQWPYFQDRNSNGQLDDDEELLGVFNGLNEAEPRLGVGGTVAVGAAFGRGRTMQALRFGISTDIFPARVDLLEARPEVESPSRRAFWTPVVSFHVGRLTL